MLYVAGLLTTGRSTPGFNRDAWRDFLLDYELCSENDLDCAEITICRVDPNSLMDAKYRSENHSRQRVYFLRVGEYEVGETVDPIAQHKRDVSPPLLNPEMRGLQRRFANELRPIVERYGKSDEIEKLMRWIDWEEVDEDRGMINMRENHENTADEEVDGDFECDTPIKVPNKNDDLIYPPNSPMKRQFPLLCHLSNIMDFDLMDRSTAEGRSSPAAVRATSTMDNLLREITQFRAMHAEAVAFESVNSKKKVRLFFNFFVMNLFN